MIQILKPDFQLKTLINARNLLCGFLYWLKEGHPPTPLTKGDSPLRGPKKSYVYRVMKKLFESG